MTVSQLIEKLSLLDPTLEVNVGMRDSFSHYYISDVYAILGNDSAVIEIDHG